MVRRSLFTWLLFVFPLLLFGQLLEFAEVTRLPGAINSKAEEVMPLLSPDGKRLFFARAMSEENHGGIYAGLDIWTSDFTSKGWTRASNTIASINNKNNNVVAGISRDGKTMYYVDASSNHKMNGIYATRFLNNYWNRPELISIPGIDNLDFVGFYVSPDFDVIFLSMKAQDTHGNEDLYYSMKDQDGMWSKPRNVGATINTSGFEISPFLSADKKRLYFASSGHGGSGDADIFYSDRLYDSWETWSVPVNLGPNVNSKKFDAYFSVYGDSIGYFSSNRDGNFADLYAVEITVQKTILAEGQHYLSEDEWNTQVGKNINRTLVFPKKSSTLNAAQQELLFYIVNKIMLEKEIKFHLITTEEEDTDLTKARLAAIQYQLQKFGIDPARIYSDQLATAQKSEKGSIEIQLFQ